MTFESCRVWAFLRVIGLPDSLVERAARSTLSPAAAASSPIWATRGGCNIPPAWSTAIGEYQVPMLLRAPAIASPQGALITEMRLIP